MNNLAFALGAAGQHAEAMHRTTLSVKRRVLGEEHPDTLSIDEQPGQGAQRRGSACRGD